MKVLVTGSNGFVGKNLKETTRDSLDWNYITRSDADLTSLEETRRIFKKIQPDVIVHLASKVGGVFYNMENNIEMLEENTLINMNVLKCCREFNVKNGIFMLSTCIYPDNLASSSNKFPMKTNQIHDGLPHSSNIGYATSKRNMEIMCNLYNQQYGYNYMCLVPGNLYGEHDVFDENKSHVVPALIKKILEQKEETSDALEINGSPKTRRQFVYVKDLVNIIYDLVLMFEFKALSFLNDQHVFNITGCEYTLLELVECIQNESRKTKIIWENSHTGQYQKNCVNSFEFKFTPLSTGISNTVAWYKGVRTNIEITRSQVRISVI